MRDLIMIIGLISLALLTVVMSPVNFDDGVPRDENGTSLLDESNNLEVAIQDRTTPPVILPMVYQLNSTNLAENTTIDSYNITVNDPTTINIGDHLRIINYMADRYYFGEVLAKNGNIIGLDTPIDFVYLAGSQITTSNENLAVDGSITPKKFLLRTGDPSIPSDIDITRMIITCEADTAVDLNKFCNLPELEKGLVFRKVNNETNNIFNIKSNADIANIAYDFTVYQASNPTQATDGFASRLTFASRSKMGVMLRTGESDNLEMIVQDDLTGIVELKVTLEGHIVQE